MVAYFVRNINPYLPGGWERVLPYSGRLVIKRRSARVERRQLRAKRSHTSSRWLWIAKAKVCMYASSWRTGLRWLTLAISKHRPAPKWGRSSGHTYHSVYGIHSAEDPA
jgi:hypothetical protein